MPSLVYPIGRVLLALIFLVAGLEKIAGWDDTVAYLQARGVPAPAFFLVIATAIEMFGGALVALGLYTRAAALVLVAYLVPVTLVFHPVWLPGEASQLTNLLKNLAIMGGLLTVAAASPTPYSIEARGRRGVEERTA